MFEWPKVSRSAVASLLIGLALVAWVNPGTGAGWLFLFIVASGVAFVALACLQICIGLVRQRRNRNTAASTDAPSGQSPATATFVSRRPRKGKDTGTD